MPAHIAAHAAVAARKSKTGRKLLAGLLALVLAVPAVAVGVPVALVYVLLASMGGPADAGGCGSGPISVPAGGVAGFNPDQVKIAATIVQVGQGMGVSAHGQQIALAVSISESSLQNLDHGDAVDNSTIGIFQQGDSYGPRADRLDPVKAATAFYQRLTQVAGWESMDPGAAGHAVEIGPPSSFYDARWDTAGALLAALTGGGTGQGSCDIPATAQAAAAQLVAAINSGKLVFLEERYKQQVINMANGTATPACTLDVGILRFMVAAVNDFSKVGVSDLNRRCTGETPGAGTASQHWKGKAVDFYALDGQDLTGADPESLKLIHLLDSIAPPGSGLGQSQCRAAAGDTVTGLVNFTLQFADTCDHQHVQVP